MVKKQEKNKKWLDPSGRVRLYINLLKTGKESFKSWSRSTTIVPSFVGGFFNVHNGQRFVQIKVTNLMIGHKLGEFAHTRKAYSYKKLK